MANIKLLSSVVVSILMFHSINAQIGFTDLSKIGIIKAKNYELKLKGSPTTQSIVIKLIPNLSNLSQCTQLVLDDYKKLLDKIIIPIDKSIKVMRNAITQKNTDVKFWGAVVGGVALGVATSAQITAGIALHNSLENAKAIDQLKDSITTVNQGIQELKYASSKTVLVLNALQDQINTNIIPSINQLGCEVAKNTIGLRLNQYFSEISLIFGPNLRDPSTETLSIQAIAGAFNNDFESILSKLGYSNDDLLDVLQSKAIQARIIGVDINNYFVTLQVEYPTITKIVGATIQTFNLISFNHKGSEWFPIFPREILVKMNLISNIDLRSCTMTDRSYICSQDTSSPISYPLYQCITGNISKCIATRNVNSQVSRFALSDGVVFANCVPILCQCHTSGQTIIQERKVSNVMISKDDCNELFIDGIFITLGPKKLNRTMYSSDYEIGGQVSLDPVDIGSDISEIQNHLNKTQEYIDKANTILNRVNSNIIGKKSSVYLIVITVIIVILILIIFLWLIYLTKQLNVPNHHSVPFSNVSTVNSLSSLINNQR
ncbi:fusion protein [Plecomyxo virus]|nr:fusion protein [Plecomyxo virus]